MEVRPLPDCFVAGLLAMTDGGRFFVTSFLRMTFEIVILMAYTLPKGSKKLS